MASVECRMSKMGLRRGTKDPPPRLLITNYELRIFFRYFFGRSKSNGLNPDGLFVEAGALVPA